MHILAISTAIAWKTGPARRFAGVIDMLCHLLALGAEHKPAREQNLIALAYARLRRAVGRLDGLFRRLAEGTLPHPRAPRAPHPHPTAPRRARLPRRPGWIAGIAPHVEAGHPAFEAFLAEPDTIALCQAAPQARRILRPICRMFGIPLPPHLAPTHGTARPRPPTPHPGRAAPPPERSPAPVPPPAGGGIPPLPAWRSWRPGQASLRQVARPPP